VPGAKIICTGQNSFSLKRIVATHLKQFAYPCFDCRPSVTNHRQMPHHLYKVWLQRANTKRASRNASVHIHKELQNFRCSPGSRNLVCAWVWAQCVGLLSARHTSHNETQTTNTPIQQRHLHSWRPHRNQTSTGAACPSHSSFGTDVIIEGHNNHLVCSCRSLQTLSRRHFY
jgi:hypothetical protein